MVGATHPTVAEVREELEATGEIRQLTAVIDGVQLRRWS
jgi:hypothetical protein